ncbi:MAG: hypothetical protein ACI915_002609 [Gammaproteobacteria bacterium]|jgi:hypothetical protein
MNMRNLLFFIITLGVVVAAWKASQNDVPTTEISTRLLYPSLNERINEVRKFSISTAKSSTQLELSGTQWVVANRDNFPANFSAVKSTLLNLATTRIVEKKTSDPTNYATLGVNQPDDDGSESVLIEIRDSADAIAASLIIGKERTANSLDIPNYFARRPNDTTALLVRGDLKMSDDPVKWMDTSVVNVSTERVQSVTIDRPDEPAIQLSKATQSDNFFELAGIPEGFTSVSHSTVSSVGAVLLGVRFQDVMASDSVSGLAPSVSAIVRTFDGLVATVDLFEVDEKKLSRFQFSFDPNLVVATQAPTSSTEEQDANDGKDSEPDETLSVEDEVGKLNAAVEKWVYVLPDYKTRLIDKRFDELVKPVEEDEESPQAEVAE